MYIHEHVHVHVHTMYVCIVSPPVYTNAVYITSFLFFAPGIFCQNASPPPKKKKQVSLAFKHWNELLLKEWGGGGGGGKYLQM